VKPALFHAEATAELDEAITYYEQRELGLGLDFLSVVMESVLRIRRFPKLGARYKNTRMRHTVVRRFPYVLFYREYADVIWIAAVAHGKRRPDYWRRRKRDR
jgi:toxin ParE1/3/4